MPPPRRARAAKRPPHTRHPELEVQPRSHRADVDQVVAQPPARRDRVAAPRLLETRDPRAHRETPREPRNRALDARGEFRALGTRADQAHLAPQHVRYLRQLVEMEPAQHASHRRRARIAPRRPDRARLLFRAFGHGAELQDLEHPSAPAEPRLPVQHGAAVLETDRDRDRHPQRQPHREQRHCDERDDRQIEGALVALAVPRRAGPGRIVVSHGGGVLGHGGGSCANQLSACSHIRGQGAAPEPRHGCPLRSFPVNGRMPGRCASHGGRPEPIDRAPRASVVLASSGADDAKPTRAPQR